MVELGAAANATEPVARRLVGAQDEALSAEAGELGREHTKLCCSRRADSELRAPSGGAGTQHI